MLHRDSEVFTRHWSIYADHDPGAEKSDAKIYVRFSPSGWNQTFFALLDTGASWSVLDPELAEELGLFDVAGEPKTMLTWHGRIQGWLVPSSITLISDSGESLECEVTVLVSRDWQKGKTILGYLGFLERLRIAIDPDINTFYFGVKPAFAS